MSNYQQAKTLCNAWLSEIAKTESVNVALIKEKVEQVNTLFKLPEFEKAKLIEELEVLYSILSDHYRILDDVKPDPWIKNTKSEIHWDFWNRYRMYLEQKNYAPDTLNKMDNLTDDILDRLIRPDRNIPFDKRGLIVGHVQSGKTGNYIGLMCKAADAGYKLIIVLAGIHNSLRSQTQLRIDEGFLGFDTQLARSITQTTDRIGVGRINPTLIAHSLTTNEINGDFNRKASETSGISIGGKDPIILVIKKNASVMKNLLGWLASRGKTMEDGKKQIKNLPLLIIDDEADNASISISKNYVSGINACIRSMLKLFEQSVYIGYTATPYANIFIKQYTDDDVKGLDYNAHNIPLSLGKDIFPKNFIVNIPAPSNYIGPEKLFGIESLENIDKEIHPLKLFRIVNDYSAYIPEGHKKDEPNPEKTLNELPPTLHESIKCFFLSCAARRARGQTNEHNSMLIHVTRFIDWQDRIATLVESEVKAYVRLIEFPDRKFLNELKWLWEDRFVATTKEIINNPSVNDLSIVEMSWMDIEPHLYAAVAKIEIRAVHGDTNINRLKHKNIRPLDYYDHRKTGLSVIAVGGNKLSRGLTLEGLTISYFLRASKMYDTLMQMGRWFGYRPGYLDLCRLYTSEELVKWYQHITVATEEMRAEFDRMGDLDKTPADYGLKVRTHPDSLVITAANKFRYKKIMTLSLSGVLEETYSFRKNDPRHLENYNETLKLVNNMGLPDGTVNNESILRNHFVWRGRNNADRIIDYLYGYNTIQPTFNVNLINRFISEQQKHGLITDWTVVLINNTTTDNTVRINADVTVGLTKRSDFTPESNYYTINKSHIIDPRHEYIDLTDEEIKIAFNKTIEDAKGNGKNVSKIDKPSPVRIKEIRSEKQALLLIYLLDPQPKDKPPFSSIPIVGLAVSFPWMKNARPIEYAVNEQFLKELDYSDELDSQELEEPLTAVEKDNELEQLEVLENKIENKFKEEQEKTQKWRPAFLYGTDKLNVIGKKTGAVPVIKDKDIHRYYINQYVDSWVENSEHLLINKGLVVSTAEFRIQNFSISEQSMILDNRCLAIWIPEIPSEYLSAILNSVFFTYYNRSKVGLATEQVIEKFPFIYLEQYSHGISILVKCILTLHKEQSSRESCVLSSFFMNVLDVVIFEIYFPEIFEANRLNILSELQNLAPFENDTEHIKRYYQLLNTPQSHVKKAIYDITTIPEFKLIYQTLTNEN